MIIEALFPEITSLYGDGFNTSYLCSSVPDATIIKTQLGETPYFSTQCPNIITIGSMTEKSQRRIIKELLPYRTRIKELIEADVVILATGNAGEIFMNDIHYVSENIHCNALNFFNYNVQTDYFNRYSGKILGLFENMSIVGFRSTFSHIFGQENYLPFIKLQRGIGYNDDNKTEGIRYRNLFCTSIIGPILPLNPLFTEYLMSLTGLDATAAHRKAALAAYQQRLHEFSDPKTKF